MSVTPETPVRVSITQAIAIAMAIAAAGFATGAVYPRIFALETAVSQQSRALGEVAKAVQEQGRTIAAINARLEERR